MTITIDKFGRILIPKKLREELHLGPDDAVELRLEDGSIRITPAQAEVRLRRVGRVLVAEAEARGDLERALERLRDERLEDAASW